MLDTALLERLVGLSVQYWQQLSPIHTGVPQENGADGELLGKILGQAEEPPSVV